ncbi:MAG: SDR family oxidoreductase [bacterium]|nr:SDR family oxidoreductase [bacterium]
MAENPKPVAMIIGATSKWQSDGRNTHLAHGGDVDDSDLPPTVRWGVGGALALRFASEGHHVVLTTRMASNAAALEAAIRSEGGSASTTEMDVVEADSITAGFADVTSSIGAPDVVIYNVGYLEGRDLPPDKELLEHVPLDIFETAQHLASRGPFLVAQAALPAMRERGRGSFLITNNPAAFRGRKRQTGQSLYYPRVMMRHLAQVLTEEYGEHGVHVANVIIDGLIDSPGTRALDFAQKHPEYVIDPAAIADAYWFLHSQPPSCWSHELQLTPAAAKPSF